jgi:hypothetical protein
MSSLAMSRMHGGVTLIPQGVVLWYRGQAVPVKPFNKYLGLILHATRRGYRVLQIGVQMRRGTTWPHERCLRRMQATYQRPIHSHNIHVNTPVACLTPTGPGTWPLQASRCFRSESAHHPFAARYSHWARAYTWCVCAHPPWAFSTPAMAFGVKGRLVQPVGAAQGSQGVMSHHVLDASRRTGRGEGWRWSPTCEVAGCSPGPCMSS